MLNNKLLGFTDSEGNVHSGHIGAISETQLVPDSNISASFSLQLEDYANNPTYNEVGAHNVLEIYNFTNLTDEDGSEPHPGIQHPLSGGLNIGAPDDIEILTRMHEGGIPDVRYYQLSSFVDSCSLNVNGNVGWQIYGWDEHDNYIITQNDLSASGTDAKVVVRYQGNGMDNGYVRYMDLSSLVGNNANEPWYIEDNNGSKVFVRAEYILGTKCLQGQNLSPTSIGESWATVRLSDGFISITTSDQSDSTHASIKICNIDAQGNVTYYNRAPTFHVGKFTH